MTHPLVIYNKESFLSPTELEFWNQFAISVDHLQTVQNQSTQNLVQIQYTLRISGPVEQVLWGSPHVNNNLDPLEKLRKNEIWKSTCFEFFLAPSLEATSPYLEMNLNLSKNWNLYTLSAYRAQLNELDINAVKKVPQVVTEIKTANQLELQIQTTCELPWTVKHMGFTVILESQQGLKSYWALAHCSPQPDFHNKESFKIAF